MTVEKPIKVNILLSVEEEMQIGLEVQEEQEINLNVFEYGGKEAPIFEGPYEVTSRFHEKQVFDTSEKLMEDDLVVKEVPYHETTNESGGLTLFIGRS